MSEDFEYRNLHPELHATLLLFHQINGKHLKAVWRFYEGTDLDKVMLSFDEESLLIEAEPYDDTISISVLHNDERRTEGWLASSDSEPWNNFVGKSFGWGWVAINQQDALDSVLLSFEGLSPQLFLMVMASSIKENIIVPFMQPNQISSVS